MSFRGLAKAKRSVLAVLAGVLSSIALCSCSDDATEQPYCGVHAIFNNDGECECQPNRSDCNDDRSTEGGDGCECPGACQGGLCVGSIGSCDPAANDSCKSNIRYCDKASEECKDCPADRYNCDFTNDNACESDKPCGGGGCDPTEEGACGEQGYCDSNSKTCTDCDPSWFNCDGKSSNKCEAQTACNTQPEGCKLFVWKSCNSDTQYCTNNTSPPSCRDCDEGMFNCDGENATKCESDRPCGIGSCDVECATSSDVLCVKDNAGTCQECVEDKHCGERELAGGPTCDTAAKVCVCADHDDCKGRPAGIVCQEADSHKRCGCDGDQHCPFPQYPKCGTDKHCVAP